MPLSDKGLAEAKAAGELLRKEGYVFDKAYTSVLRRAIKTLWCVLEETDLMWIPVEKSWKLNERHYGALQGLNKAETAAKYGDAQVKIWRRSYATRPPLLEQSDERWPGHEARGGRAPARRVPRRHRRARRPLLGERHSPRHPRRQAHNNRRARQQPPRARQIPRRSIRAGHRRAQHPHRRAARPCRSSTSSTTSSSPSSTTTSATPKR